MKYIKPTANALSGDTFSISDTHLGPVEEEFPSKHNDLVKLLTTLVQNNVKYNNIVLNGDIIEDWYISAKSALRKGSNTFQLINTVFILLDKLWNGKGEKVYVPGNHCKNTLLGRLPKATRKFLHAYDYSVKDIYRTNDNVVYVHGHQGQYNKVTWFLSVLGGRLLYAVRYIIPGYKDIIKVHYPRITNYVESTFIGKNLEYYAKLSTKIRLANEVIVFSHTHKPQCLHDYGMINTGDWVHSATFLVRKKSKDTKRDTITCYRYNRRGMEKLYTINVDSYLPKEKEQ